MENFVTGTAEELCLNTSSKITLDFFNDPQSLASKLIAVSEENQMRTSCQLDYFEKRFEVVEAVRSMTDTQAFMQKRVYRKKQIISDKAKNEWNTLIERVERQFQEDAFSASEARVTMENILHTCSKKVCQPTEHLENAKLVDQLNKDYAAEIKSSME
ncbi:uncharacterized protein A4U43_C07F3060 [Asparagus officinalis]|uniref:Uncharacterized protein n=1 Tax=Asparagus officinalis TaxID=4686 RepID=A0A5P1E925_ASPOF|nr:uncharacterized protein A4U43_C07F3060 [Asparagus officinalis]